MFGWDVRFVIRRLHEPLRYTLEHYGERQASATIVLTADDPAPIHAYLDQRFGR